MGAARRPRRPLPRRVYWFRRALVLGVLSALVIGLASGLGALIGGYQGGDGDREEEATTVAAEPSTTASESATATPRRSTPKPAARRTAKRLPQPDGPCSDGDVLVTPAVPPTHEGEPIRIVLHVGTVEEPACTWRVGPETVVVTVSDTERTLWSSQQCPAQVPTADVVARREKPARVVLTWRGRESDAACSRLTPWVLAGQYTVTAVAVGSVQPMESDFVLAPAPTPTVTVTAKPTPTGTPTAD